MEEVVEEGWGCIIGSGGGGGGKLVPRSSLNACRVFRWFQPHLNFMKLIEYCCFIFKKYQV